MSREEKTRGEGEKREGKTSRLVKRWQCSCSNMDFAVFEEEGE